MPTLHDLLNDAKIHIYDGAYGTLMQQRGLPAGASPEVYCMDHPELIASVHRDYLKAGAEVLTTNTFGGSGPKLGEGVDVYALNKQMVEIARQVNDEVTGGKALISGAVGPCGHFCEPLGPLTFRELVEIFKTQIKGIVDGGADFIKAETLFDLAEARAIVLAAREVCDLPILVSMTFEDGLSLTGSTPEVFADTMANMGVDVISTNCSAGPDQMLENVKRYAARTATPIHAQPNAGLPQLVDGETVFPLDPVGFSGFAKAFAEAGVKFMGGCCGSGPDHIAKLAEAMAEYNYHKPTPTKGPGIVLTSRSQSVAIGHDQPAAIIGERINPTGKEQLTKELQEGVFTEALKLAGEQLDDGARILDVNVGAPMVDEADLLPKLVKTLVERVQAPLCIDSTDPDAIEEALWNYPGSALVNSISGEPGRMERLAPICKKHGAPFILLPLVGRKLPVTTEERLEVIEGLLKQADELGVPRRLIMVDTLVLTASSKPEAATACMEVARHCRDVWGLPTTCGLSNISFGLPARELVNVNFAVMGMASGFTSFIANPSSARLREAMAAAEVLLNRDPQAGDFIAGYSDWTAGSDGSGGSVGGGGGGSKKKAEIKSLGDAVIHGAKDDICRMIDAELEAGKRPFDIVKKELIPGILEVGAKYERKEYFLPQLMLSAETMQTAFSHIQPLLEADGAEAEVKPLVLMATVEGDIHDIGKNIVCLLLKNHGFEVEDIGKDITADVIVAAAKEKNAAVIGLSALMTTTMVKMEEVVELARKEGLTTPIMLGGAVVSHEYAEKIGAQGYAEDAVAAVKLAQRLTGNADEAPVQ